MLFLHHKYYNRQDPIHIESQSYKPNISTSKSSFSLLLIYSCSYDQIIIVIYIILLFLLFYLGTLFKHQHMLKFIILLLISYSIIALHHTIHDSQRHGPPNNTNSHEPPARTSRTRKQPVRPAKPPKPVKSLIFVQSLHTHGLTYPTVRYNFTTDEDRVKDQNLGELTDIGRKMQYQLGKIMYKKYWEQMFGTQKLSFQQLKQKFLFKSSALNHTVESALALSFGLFQNLPVDNITVTNASIIRPPFQDEQIDQSDAKGPIYGYYGMHNHFIRIHQEDGQMTLQNDGGSLSKSNALSCPFSSQWSTSNYQIPHYVKILNTTQFRQALTYYNNFTHQNLTLQQFRYNYELFLKENSLGFNLFQQSPLPSEKKVTLDHLYTLSKYVQFTGQKQQVKAYSLPYINEVMVNFKRAFNPEERVKWITSTSDEITMMSILALMGLTTPQCISHSFQQKVNARQSKNQQFPPCITQIPPSSSSLIFQLYSLKGHPFSFQIKYNGKYLEIPFCNYNTQCELQDAQKWFLQYLREDIREICGFFEIKDIKKTKGIKGELELSNGKQDKKGKQSQGNSGKTGSYRNQDDSTTKSDKSQKLNGNEIKMPKPKN